MRTIAAIRTDIDRSERALCALINAANDREVPADRSWAIGTIGIQNRLLKLRVELDEALKLTST